MRLHFHCDMHKAVRTRRKNRSLRPEKRSRIVVGRRVKLRALRKTVLQVRNRSTTVAEKDSPTIQLNLRPAAPSAMNTPQHRHSAVIIKQECVSFFQQTPETTTTVTKH